MPDLSLAAAVQRLAAHAPGTPSVRDHEDATWTAADLDAAAASLATVLAEGGVRAGDRVCWAGRNDPGLLVTLLAAQRLGAVFAPLAYRWVPGEAAAALRLCAAHTVVVHPELDEVYRAVRDAATPVRRWWRWDADLLAAAPTPGRVAHPDDVALLLFSSGTSGAPKAAMLTHANLWWSARNLEAVLGTPTPDVTLAVAPMCHVGGLNGLVLSALGRGGTVLVRRGFDARRTLEDMAVAPAMFGVPAMYAAVARLPEFAAADLSGLTSAIVGGAAVPRALLDAYRARGGELLPSWGMTELAPCGSLLPREHVAAAPGTVGWPLPYLDVDVVDPATGRPVAVPGSVGEIVARGPQVFTGYWGDAEATSAVLRDGALRTGDLGFLDAQGRITLVGRSSEVINTGGEKVPPEEVEVALAALRLPGLGELAVVGVPDATWGEVVVAVAVGVAPDAGAVGPVPGAAPDLAELRALGARTLAGHKLPRHLVLVADLPRTESGKVDRRAVRALAAERLGAALD